MQKDETIEKILLGEHFAPLQSVLGKYFEKNKGEALYGKIETTLKELLQAHQVEPEALRAESHHYILPSIAIYTVLREYLGMEQALSAFREIYFHAAYENAAFLRERAASSEAFWRNFPHLMAEGKTGESGGFSFQLIADTPEGAEFHVLRCPYLTFCMQYGCRELTPVFCECDDIFYGNIHPRLAWERDKTLGRGDALCNFKFRILDAPLQESKV